MQKKISIAIDGPAAAGKSTVARSLAEQLGICHVDTGALYRAIGYYAAGRGADTASAAEVVPLLDEIEIRLRFTQSGQRILLNGRDVSEQIRLPEVSMAASNVSAIPEVRQFLLELQRSLARRQSVVMDGRDIGTVVLPDATVKFFLTATPETRARRRLLEHRQKGQDVDFNTLLAEIIRRDHNDSSRAAAPLRRADDAVEVDSTLLALDETIARMISIVKGRL
jgi:cytidylate kinase